MRISASTLIDGAQILQMGIAGAGRDLNDIGVENRRAATYWRRCIAARGLAPAGQQNGKFVATEAEGEGILALARGEKDRRACAFEKCVTHAVA